MVALLVAQGAELVVVGALVRVFQHLPGFCHVLELGFGVVFLADIRVIFAGQKAVGRLDGGSVGVWLHSEQGVVVLKVHFTSPGSDAPSLPYCYFSDIPAE